MASDLVKVKQMKSGTNVESGLFLIKIIRIIDLKSGVV